MGYDISSNKLGDVDKDFSGMILIKKWDNTNVTRTIIRNGKVVQRYTGQPLLSNRMSCNGTLVTEYVRDCEVHIYGDGMVTEECDPWMPTGNQWCLEDDPASGSSSALPALSSIFRHYSLPGRRLIKTLTSNFVHIVTVYEENTGTGRSDLILVHYCTSTKN